MAFAVLRVTVVLMTVAVLSEAVDSPNPSTHFRDAMKLSKLTPEIESRHS